jgi:hypothetical protein
LAVSEEMLTFAGMKTSHTMRPLILISNDDGYQAKGINSLTDMVRDMGDVLVAPPTARAADSRWHFRPPYR